MLGLLCSPEAMVTFSLILLQTHMPKCQETRWWMPFLSPEGTSWAEVVRCCWYGHAHIHWATFIRSDASLAWFQRYGSPLTCCGTWQHQSSGARTSVGNCCSCCLHLTCSPSIRGYWSRNSFAGTWLLKPTTSKTKLPNPKKKTKTQTTKQNKNLIWRRQKMISLLCG